MAALSLPAIPGTNLKLNSLAAKREEYQERKKREELERISYLPPGLVNHGNTCFMNSVLQTLLATRLLNKLVLSKPISSDTQNFSKTPLSMRRSPLLTNGHKLGGEHEQPWVNSMPLGDELLYFLLKGWEYQTRKSRDSLSPRSLLGAIGQKHSEYRYLAQQDAHEFLRHLLDGMRMEEQDIIKKRQPPPPPQPKKRRRTTITPSNSGSAPLQILGGGTGTLTSLQSDNSASLPLPHPPQTPNKDQTERSDPPQDTPLSISVPSTSQEPIPEEEKLLSLADMIFGGRLTSILVCQKCKHISQTYEDFNDISLSIKPETHQHAKKRDRLKKFAKRLTTFQTPNLNVGGSIPRPSSVPPSPSPAEKQLGADNNDLPPDSRRRKSLEETQDNHDHVEDSGPSTPTKDESSIDSDGSAVIVKGSPLLETIEEAKKLEKLGKKAKKDEQEKEGTDWTKIGRRISMSVRLGRKSRSRESRDSRKPDTSSELQTRSVSDSAASVVSQSLPTPDIHLHPPSSPGPRASGEHGKKSRTPSPSASSRQPKASQGKSPKVPKLSEDEEAYLRKILADVHVSAGHSISHIFKHPTLQAYQSKKKLAPHPGGTEAGLKQHLWLGTELSIEECLRMFTAVEVLDGENMVGCRRCWKIANGLYKGHEDDGGDDDEEEDGAESLKKPESSDADGDKIDDKMKPATAPASLGIQIPASVSTPTVSTPTTSFYSRGESDDADGRSVSSLPTEVEESGEIEDLKESTAVSIGEAVRQSAEANGPGGMPIPSISTTGPDYISWSSETASEADTTDASSLTGTLDTVPVPRLDQLLYRTVSTESKDSLAIPSRHSKADSDDDGSGAESDTSAGTSVSESSTSPNPKPAVKKPSKPKPTIMRPAYKRYLIDTPPPVLAIHLKRFHHLAKAPTLSWHSSWARKLEDYVSFPEYLDLSPYLAPKKEDYGLGKRGKFKQHREKKGDKCMYRLYAVVQHIGNMSGGHYVAYVALPNEAPDPYHLPASDPELSASTSTTAPAGTSTERRWAYISDQVVRIVKLEDVLNVQAYICMYERC